MATRFLSLSRSALTNKQALISFLSRSYSVSSASSSLAVSQFSPLRLRSLVAAAHLFHGAPPASVGGFRAFSSRFTQSSLNDSSPNWSNRPPKETILLDGCDFEHWLVVLEKPDENATREEIIDTYIKTLAQVVGSEEEARMKIYSVSTRHYFAFGALVSEELSFKLKELPNVRWVLPDSYLDVKNKDYGGEPFINGEAVPYDPKYHEEWVRNNAKAMERNRRNDRPRNFDRSRNFERRRQNQGPPMGGPPQGGGMPPNMGVAPPNMGGMPPNNMGGAPPNMGGMPPNNMGGMPPNNMGGGAPNMGGPPPAAGVPYNNMGGAPNMGGMPRNNMGGPPHIGGAPPNMGGQMRGPPNSGWQGNAQNFQGGGFPPQNSQGPPPNYQSSQGPPPNYQNQQGPPPTYQNSQGPPPNYQNSQGPPPNYPNSQGPPPNFQNYGPPGGNQYQPRDMPPPPPSPPRNY